MVKGSGDGTAAAGAGAGAALYGFQRDSEREAAGRRDDTAARAELSVLWKNLGGDPLALSELQVSDPDRWGLLLRYAADGPLCIQWYESRRPELERKQARYNALVMVVALVLFALAFLLPFQPLLLLLLQQQLGTPTGASSTGLVDVAALLGVVVTGTTMALRLSSRGVRYRQQAAVFHKASAALKEQLYRLETEWRGKPLVEEVDGAPRLTVAFDEAIRRAVGQAQTILADERDAFFDTLAVDVSALTDDVASAAEGLAKRTPFRTDRRHEDAQRRSEADGQLAEAELARDTAKARIAVLERELAAATDDRTRDSLRAALLAQRLQVEESEQRRLHLLQRSLR